MQTRNANGTYPDPIDGALKFRAPIPQGKPPTTDPFADLGTLRIPQDFGEVTEKSDQSEIRIMKPAKDCFIQSHPDPEYSLYTAVIDLGSIDGIYLVGPHIRNQFEEEPTYHLRLLVTAVRRDGGAFIWPLRVPTEDENKDPWATSAMQAYRTSQGEWVRVYADTRASCYKVLVAAGELPAPDWSVLPAFPDLLRAAFRDRVIDSLDHPVPRRLRGEA